MKESDNILVKQWMTLEMTMHRYCYQNFKKLGPMGNPERGQGKLLCLIRNNPGITQKELSEISNMRQQSVSELLKKLEHGQFIIRKPSLNDKRSFSFELTPRGKANAEPPCELIDSIESFFSCLDNSEKNNMSLYMQKIQNHIDNMSEKLSEKGKAKSKS